METMILPVDFNEGRTVYDDIRVALEDVDIGILGRYGCIRIHIPLKIKSLVS